MEPPGIVAPSVLEFRVYDLFCQVILHADENADVCMNPSSEFNSLSINQL